MTSQDDLSFGTLISHLGLLLAMYCALLVTYNLRFHPLSHLPGPWPWRATRLGFLSSFLSGNLVRDVYKLHQRYGAVVRIAPDEVSFAQEGVWQDALGGRNPLPRNATFFKAPPGQPDNIVMTADAAANERMRQVMMPAFTERALAKQEPALQQYTDLLIERLKEKVAASSISGHGVKVNLVDWFEWFAFDLIGELAFGESFGCLDSSKHHPWIKMIFSSIKVMAWAACTRYYAGLEPLLLRIIPARIRKMQDDHYALALDKVHRRMASQSREDFMKPMLENNPGFEKMSQPEVESSMAILILAGSETTATTLSGIGNALINNPLQLRALESEIRASFKTEGQITLKATQNLPYLNAVINEGLRICNPVAGGILRSVPKAGAIICGYSLPEGTHVLVNSTAMSLSDANFHRAGEFLPERFLPPEKRPPAFKGDQRNSQKPFGFGSRSCLGKSFAMGEMRLVLAKMIWHFDIHRGASEPVDWNNLKSYVVVEKQAIEAVLRPR
jgi:cytochrome P450